MTVTKTKQQQKKKDAVGKRDPSRKGQGRSATRNLAPTAPAAASAAIPRPVVAGAAKVTEVRYSYVCYPSVLLMLRVCRCTPQSKQMGHRVCTFP